MILVLIFGFYLACASFIYDYYYITILPPFYSRIIHIVMRI